MRTAFMKLALCAACFIIFFTKTQAQISIGPEVGFTASGLYNNNDDVYAGANFHFGAAAHFQLNNFLAVRPSLLFQTGGMSIADDYNDEKISFSRITLPVPIMYSHVFENNSNLFAGIGPDFTYIVSGKHDYADESNKIEFGSNAGQMKRFDIGFQLKGGYQFGNGLSLSTFFNLGLSNLSNEPGETLKSMDAFGFSLGWMFGGGNSGYY